MANVNMGFSKHFEDPSNVDVVDACMMYSDSIYKTKTDNQIDILEASLENTRSQLARLIDALASRKKFSNEELKAIIKGP